LLSAAFSHTFQIVYQGSKCYRGCHVRAFTKNSKNALIAHFGKGRGSLIGRKEQLDKEGVHYESIDTLKDETATGIIKGIERLPVWD